MMSALGSALPGSANAPSATSVAMTNLDAVSATHGSGGFKVSGTIGKLPGNSLRLAAGGSDIGRINTRTAAELTRGGKLGRVEAAAGSERVRAVVNSAPARTVQVQGQLDRGEIQKVVNAHLHEVQGCYERKLIREPTLAGKIVFEWVVDTTGSVGVVRIKFSDLRSSDVASCIQSSMRRWKFPEPRGGPVTITYPFVFSTVGI
jgi:hypothetical protein